MNSHIHVKIAEIKGESKDASFENTIDALGWRWGMNGNIESTASTRAKSITHVRNLVFTKKADIASAELMNYCIHHTNMTKVELIVNKAGGAAALDYVRITLQDVMVASIDILQTDGSLSIIEEVTLNFLKATFEYKTQSNKGGQDNKYSMEWIAQDSGIRRGSSG